MVVTLMRLAWLATLLLGIQAQTGPQANQLPACIKACDPAAIASVNCTNADQYCHCVKQDGIISNITACADTACVNPSASLYTFTYLFGDVCSQFNITVPIIGSNTSANGTIVTLPTLTPSPSPSASSAPYKGAANSRGFGQDSVALASFVTAFSLLGMVVRIF